MISLFVLAEDVDDPSFIVLTETKSCLLVLYSVSSASNIASK
jgi:hypothetical protein